MRVEPFTVDSYVHCLKRGARGFPIVNEDADMHRYHRALFYMNDIHVDENWSRQTKHFDRLSEWPERTPLVKILAYILMPNHIHLLLKEIQEGGISLFMKKFGNSVTGYYNEKYNNKGSIFQGSYKGKTIDEDMYLRYLAVYIMVKNAFELFPGGLKKAVENFEDAWLFAVQYPFSSLGDYVIARNSPVIDKEILGELWSGPKEFKKFAREVMEGRNVEIGEDFKALTLE